MSSRICVKHLPKYADDAELLKFLHKSFDKASSKSKLEITDCKVLKKAGKSRRLAFVGFRNEEQAKLAQKLLNKTFFDTSRILTEVALPIGDKRLNKPWLKKKVGDNVTDEDKNKTKEIKEKKKVDKKKVLNEFSDIIGKKAKELFWNSDEELDEDESKVASNEISTKRKEVEFSTPRLFIRNLNYETTEEHLREFFGNFGEVSECTIIVDDQRRSKGFAFVGFERIEHAMVAQRESDGTSLQGRLIHVLPALQKISPSFEIEESNDAGGANSSFKREKEKETKKDAQNETNWNSLFIRSDAALSAFTSSTSGLNMSKFDIINDPEMIKEKLKEAGRESNGVTNSAAVNLALMETSIIKETKEFLVDNGIDLKALEFGLKNPFQIKRSGNVILVKNLPNDTNAAELRQMFVKFGNLQKFVLPPSKTMALVSFASNKDATQAFRNLSYKRYKRLPLYLEFAPEAVLDVSPPAVTPEEEEQTEEIISNAVVPKESVDTPALEEKTVAKGSTLFVKNLNFDTNEEALRSHVEELTGFKGRLSDNLRKVSITKHMKNGKSLSRGFAFVEFSDSKICKIALRKLNKTTLDNHELEVSLSLSSSEAVSQKKNAQSIKMMKRKLISTTEEKVASASKSTPNRTKLLVKNLAFEATKAEITKLFATFGDIQSVRLPKGFSNKPRGFCFVTFASQTDAQGAFDALQSTHLYGRRLVLEWATNITQNLTDLQEKAQKDLKVSESSKKRHRAG